jgi:hypothetical protein
VEGQGSLVEQQRRGDSSAATAAARGGGGGGADGPAGVGPTTTAAVLLDGGDAGAQVALSGAAAVAFPMLAAVVTEIYLCDVSALAKKR